MREESVFGYNVSVPRSLRTRHIQERRVIGAVRYISGDSVICCCSPLCFCLFSLFFKILYVSINSYGHVETVSPGGYSDIFIRT